MTTPRPMRRLHAVPDPVTDGEVGQAELPTGELEAGRAQPPTGELVTDYHHLVAVRGPDGITELRFDTKGLLAELAMLRAFGGSRFAQYPDTDDIFGPVDTIPPEASLASQQPRHLPSRPPLGIVPPTDPA